MNPWFKKMRVICFLSLCGFLAGVPTNDVNVIEGNSLTLQTGLKANIQSRLHRIKWYFKGNRIAQTIGSLKKICTDDHCEKRFRDRLKLDSHTGDLTVTNTRTTDSGHYKLHIFNRRNNFQKIFNVAVHDLSGVETVSVSVMEGDSVTLHTGVETKHQDRIRWFYNDIHIAQITGDLSRTCTDVQCNEGTERFRDRLKLDHQTGSLTITNTRNTDSGDYKLEITSRNSERIFNVTAHNVSAAERDELHRKSVMQGEPVTLDPSVVKDSNYLMTWYFNETLIAEITGDQSQICADDQCKERYRDRLKLDHQTGSLTITNTRNTDSGDYKLQINSIRFSIIRSFSVSVTAVPGSYVPPEEGSAAVLSSGAVAGIVVLLLVVAAAAVAGGVKHCNPQGYTRACSPRI